MSYVPTSKVNAEPRRSKRLVYVLTRAGGGEECPVHGVFSTAEKAETAAEEWTGRECGVSHSDLSIDEFEVDA